MHVQSSTIYLKVSTETGVLYSIKADWYSAKKDVPKDSVKAGNKGLIDYSINTAD